MQQKAPRRGVKNLGAVFNRTKTMQLNAYTILVILALLFAVASMIRPNWPLCPIAVVFLAVAALIK